jgi:hypothetical protein
MATRSDATDDPGRSGTAGEEITPQQEAAIVALLERPSVSAAAELAGVGRSTLYEWLQRPAFRAAYREARREAFSVAVARLQQVSAEAVEALREVMNDPSQQGAARVGAARAVLDYALRAVETEEVLARVEDLEGRYDDARAPRAA